VWKPARLNVWKQKGSNANNKRIFNSLAAVIYKNIPNAALSSEKVAQPCCKESSRGLRSYNKRQWWT